MSSDATGEALREARDDALHADQKAGLLLAALGVIVGVVVAAQLGGDVDFVATLRSPEQAVWWTGGIAGAASVAAAAMAVWPRFRRVSNGQLGPAFWADYAAFSDASSLLAAIDSKSDQAKLRDAQKLLEVSTLVRLKYRYVRASLILAAVGAISLGVVLPISRLIGWGS